MDKKALLVNLGLKVIEILGITAFINALLFCFIYINIITGSSSIEAAKAKIAVATQLIPLEWGTIAEITLVAVVFIQVLFFFTEVIKEKMRDRNFGYGSSIMNQNDK